MHMVQTLNVRDAHLAATSNSCGARCAAIAVLLDELLKITAGEQDTGGDQDGGGPGDEDQQGYPGREQACLGVPGHDPAGDPIVPGGR